jgi:proteasome component ECM29
MHRKENLVNNLLDTLQGNKPSNVGFKLTEDTQVFPEDLIKTPDGEGLSTYKELCSLANEMGQPTLVYKAITFSIF